MYTLAFKLERVKCCVLRELFHHMLGWFTMET